MKRFLIYIGLLKPRIVPRSGETWTLDSNFYRRDPFEPTKEGVDALILEVRDGWVRYSLGGIFNDERMPVREFCGIYSRFLA
jgi:hypothetical protein